MFPHPLHKSIVYDGKMSLSGRINVLMDWIQYNPAIRYAQLYFSTVDEVGHHYGPSSRQMSNAIKTVSSAVVELVNELKKRRLWSRTTLLIVSDHGMTDAVNDSHIAIEELVPELKKLILWIDSRPVTFVTVKSGSEDLVYDLLRASKDKLSLPFDLYWTRDLPQGWHMVPSNRVGPITLIAHKGYTFAKAGMKRGSGLHGYDPDMLDMHAMFMATGPDIAKRGQIREVYSNLDVYSVLISLLAIGGERNDGSSGLERAILAHDLI